MWPFLSPARGSALRAAAVSALAALSSGAAGLTPGCPEALPAAPPLVAPDSVRLRAGDLVAYSSFTNGSCALDAVLFAPRDTTVRVLGGGLAREPCRPEWTVFAPDRAVLRVVPRTGVVPAGAPDRIYQGRPALRVPLNVWVLSGHRLAVRIANQSIDRATALFLLNRVGVRFEPSAVYSPEALPEGVSLDEAESAIGKGCDNTESLLARGSPFYLADHINVYVIDEIVLEGWGAGARGINCYQYARTSSGLGPDNIIYVSFWYQDEATLTHELGHAFSLRDDKETGQKCGHAGWGYLEPYCPGVDRDNMMWDWSDPEGVREHFTLGQAYRMNVDSRSWLNTSGPRRRAGSRVCQDRCFGDGACGVATPCPRIGFDAPTPVAQ